MSIQQQLAPLGLALAVAAFGASASHAQSTFDTAVLAGTCFNCHGTDGRSPGAIPSLAGRPQSVLEAQLLAFHAGDLPPGTTIMGRIAAGYSEDELKALAAWFANVDPNAPVAPAGKEN